MDWKKDDYLFVGDPANDIVDPGNQHTAVRYTPFVSKDGRVGYAATRTVDGERETAFVYLYPSDTSADICANVFVYSGPSNDPALDSPHSFVGIDDETFDPEAQG